jgi:phosphoglycerol transferase
MKGRSGDAWYQQTASLSPAQMVAELKASGFSAIWVDRDGYDDDGQAIERALSAALGGEAPLVSENGDIAVFIIK